MRSWTRAPAAVTLLLTVAAGQATTARGAESAQIEAIEISDASAIAHDGRLLDAIWETAPVIDAFVQRTPHEGAAPSFPTQARVAYDATNLYVSVRAFDPEPEAIVGILTRRDENSPSDWLRIAIDSYHDGRTAYEFAVNPVGVKQDKYRFNDNAEDVSWDAVWDVVVSRDAEGWAAEFRIPFSQLRFESGNRWHVRFCGGPASWTPERDVDMAAARAKRQRHGVVVRRPDWPEGPVVWTTTRARAVHGFDRRHAAGRAW